MGLQRVRRAFRVPLPQSSLGPLRPPGFSRGQGSTSKTLIPSSLLFCSAQPSARKIWRFASAETLPPMGCFTAIGCRVGWRIERREGLWGGGFAGCRLSGNWGRDVGGRCFIMRLVTHSGGDVTWRPAMTSGIPLSCFPFDNRHALYSGRDRMADRERSSASDFVQAVPEPSGRADVSESISLALLDEMVFPISLLAVVLRGCYPHWVIGWSVWWAEGGSPFSSVRSDGPSIPEQNRVGLGGPDPRGRYYFGLFDGAKSGGCTTDGKKEGEDKTC